VSSMHHGAGGRPWRSLLCVAALLAAASLLTGAGSATADCTTGGSACTPNGSYATDDIWNCGVIDQYDDCYFDSAKNVPGLATPRSWGWGSASYGGAGSAYVCVEGGAYFFSCGTNLARACYSRSCTDQSAASFLIWIENFTGAHTVSGHAKA
jgi:hypothetical protein